VENGVINYDPFLFNKKFGKLWSTNTRDYTANVYPPEVNSAHFAYANAFEFGPCGFAVRGISAP